MNKTVKHLLGMALLMLLTFTLTVCAAAEDVPDATTLADMKMAQPGALYSDIIAGIDPGSVTADGDATFFTATMSDGTPVRFEGTNIAVSESGITLQPDSRLISLDAVGKIYLYRATVLHGDTSPTGDQWLDIGYGYTFSGDKTSVARASDVAAELMGGYPASLWNTGISLSIAWYEPNFVLVKGSSGNTEGITLTSLVIGYDPTVKVTAREDIIAELPDFFAADTAALPDDTEPVVADVPVEDVPIQPAAPSWDIVAGIDRSSVTTDGNATFFTATTDDGTPVRFEGTNIAVTAEGIRMEPSSRITSLDAVGKIYSYHAAIMDQAESPICDQWLNAGYGYTFSVDKTSVVRASDVHTGEISGYPALVWSPEVGIVTADFEPNFIFVTAPEHNTVAFTLTSLTISCDPAKKVTAITSAALYPTQYGYYMEGEPYNAAKEDKADAASSTYDFYLLLNLETESSSVPQLWFLPRQFYTVGDLKGADGQVKDKATARVLTGDTLDVTIGDYTLPVALPMAELYTGAQTLKDVRPYSTLSALGEQHALVVPVVWADQTHLVSDEVLALYRKALGSIIDQHGTPVADDSVADDALFSLSEYFATASYGQLSVSTFMTDWYYTDKRFANEYEFVFPEIDFADEVLQWVKATYPELDWTQFDQDGDGYVDALVLISVGLAENEGYAPGSFGGAVHATATQYGDRAGTQADPQVNCFLTVNHFFLQDGDTTTLLHEFSHNFGLNDYYDGTGYGINAVGGYDMQGSSVGDWNAYSKLIVGWMQPQVITGLASGGSVDVTIRSSALTGDVLLLPASGASYDGPFGEYVMLDLLTPDGVNTYAAAEYALQDTQGVRISHVNANMRRVTEGKVPIGMELKGNHYQQDGFGCYNIEVIQAGKENTFTDLDKLYPFLRAEDLFYEGSVFTAEDYDQFFYEGLMDSGMPLGYTVTILSIADDADGIPTATIRITAE